jgi:uncharacterized membrane protein YgcG
VAAAASVVVGSAVAAVADSVGEARAVAGKARLSKKAHAQVAAAVDAAEETTGLQFCVYLGPTEDDARAHAERIFVDAGLHSRPAVLLLVAPPERRVEIVTAPEVRDRVSDQACQAAIEAMTVDFKAGDFAGGISTGIAHLAAVAGPGSAPDSDDGELPDIIEE